MKHSLEFTTALFCIALGLSLNTLNAAQPWTPSQADLDAAVANASQQWGIEVPVTITLDPAKSCGVYNAARRKNKKDQDEEPKTLADVAAITDYKKSTGVTTTTITFPEGDVDNGEEPIRISEEHILSQTFVSAPSEHLTHYIHINASCEWSPEFLHSIVLHEYGHALGIRKHSRNDRSIMYWMVFRPDAVKKYFAQSITDTDRSSVPVQSASIN